MPPNCERPGCPAYAEYRLTHTTPTGPKESHLCTACLKVKMSELHRLKADPKAERITPQ